MFTENALKAHDYLLSVRNLKTHFRNDQDTVEAVSGISFNLSQGQTVGIVGESGSGKSVTALSIMQLITYPGEIVAGEVRFKSPQLGELDLLTCPKNIMRKVRGEEIAMIFQEPMSSLNPVFTCGDQIMEALRVHRNLPKNELKHLALESFREVQLPDPEAVFKSYPHEISGGQKQRVMIAMAISCEPQILIADEPTTALDVTVQAGILALLRRLRDEKNMSIIFISHDLGVIAEIADWVIVMYQGKIVEQGDVFEIFAHPKHPYTKGLLACRPRLDHKLHVLPTVKDFMATHEDGSFSEVIPSQKYHSVGEAILKNVVSPEEILVQQHKLLQKPPLLQVDHLKKYFSVRDGLFGKSTTFVKAVDDVSFSVYPGETLGLVGESGCGKTTLGRTILMLEEPTEGKIVFDGRPVDQLSGKHLRQLRKDIQIVFQDPYSSLNPRMTVGEAIIEPMITHRIGKNPKERRDRMVQLLETVNLKAELFNRYPHEFSGGQRQRICIARALAVEPQFIIFDESVSALDVSVQAQVLNLLNQLKRDYHFTYIFISHDLSVVKFLADRILVMNRGSIVESGYPEEIYENPRNSYTKKLIKAIPSGKLEDIRKLQMERKKKTV